MSKMLAEIRRIVTEDVSNRISQYDVIYEAITNAIHANATKIICTLHCAAPALAEGGDAIDNDKVDNITVSDNGDGLDTNNYESFGKYRTEHKKALGCKGVGRFVFLKVYQNVYYKSLIAKEQKERSFVFNFDFDTDDTIEVPSVVESNSTEIKLVGLSPQYLDLDYDLDKRIFLDLNIIREKVLLHLMPTLFFYKKKGAHVEINFVDENSGEVVYITEADVPIFSEAPFKLRDRDGEVYDFKLHFQLENHRGKLYAYYCANNRTVNEFSDHDLKITLPFEYSGYLLLESDYFDSHVNNERNGFDIFPVKADFASPLSWEMINASLKSEVSKIVKQKVPDTEKINAVKLQEIQQERPYLTNYIDEQDIDMAGFLDKKHIITNAKKKFDNAKEKVLVNAGKEEYTDKELQDAIQVAQNELVSYINDRAQVLERLQKLIDKKESVEKVIHDLFMQMGTTDDYFSVGKNNLWLLDDRFTSYSYAASDKKIKSTIHAIGETTDGIENELEEPDLALFFSSNPANNATDVLKSVLIEIKPFDFDRKSDKQKFQGIQQLIDYVEAFKSKEKVQEIYGFLITDIDDKLANRLEGDSYIPIFSTDSPIYHRHYEKRGISIYVVSARTLIKDAEARNRVFLDIIRKQSRLNKLLEKILPPE